MSKKWGAFEIGRSLTKAHFAKHDNLVSDDETRTISQIGRKADGQGSPQLEGVAQEVEDTIVKIMKEATSG